MRVSLIRGGGFSGLVRIITADTDSLAPEEARELVARVEEADLFDLPAKVGAGPDQPDRFSYVVTVEEGRRRHQVQLSEGSLPEELRSLIKWVRALPGRVETIGPSEGTPP